ncbi:MAG TPA: hypothetical protein VNK91_00595 [Burkholderiaceae bacterium]|jgi:hypothetical protein|nr:hypothetical protein [Burkholderiaceae bacterium]
MKTLLSVGAALLAAGCASNEPFAQLDGQRWNRVELNTYDVTIISVDGEHYVQRGTPIVIKPGPHKIVVQGPPTAGFRFGEQRVLELNAEPCMRYWLEAKKANALSQDFEPRVNYKEPIAGCGK